MPTYFLNTFPCIPFPYICEGGFSRVGVDEKKCDGRRNHSSERERDEDIERWTDSNKKYFQHNENIKSIFKCSIIVDYSAVSTLATEWMMLCEHEVV